MTSPLFLAATASCVWDLNCVFSSIYFTYFRTVQVERCKVDAISLSVSPLVSSRRMFSSCFVKSVLRAAPIGRLGECSGYRCSPSMTRSMIARKASLDGSLYQKLSTPARFPCGFGSSHPVFHGFAQRHPGFRCTSSNAGSCLQAVYFSVPVLPTDDKVRKYSVRRFERRPYLLMPDFFLKSPDFFAFQLKQGVSPKAILRFSGNGSFFYYNRRVSSCQDRV